MATNFPTSLDDFANYVDGTTIMEAATLNNMQFAIEALEAKVGIDSSGVATSHDYKISHNVFGSWVSRTVDTVYQAASDGFVLVTGSGTTTINIYSDGLSSPFTLRAGSHSDPPFVMSPIKKNDYWKVTGTVASIYWLPIGV